MTTVWIYVDTSKDVGDRDHLKVFEREAAANEWLKPMTRKAWRLSMMFGIAIRLGHALVPKSCNRPG